MGRIPIRGERAVLLEGLRTKVPTMDYDALRTENIAVVNTMGKVVVH